MPFSQLEACAVNCPSDLATDGLFFKVGFDNSIERILSNECVHDQLTPNHKTSVVVTTAGLKANVKIQVLPRVALSSKTDETTPIVMPHIPGSL